MCPGAMLHPFVSQIAVLKRGMGPNAACRDQTLGMLTDAKDKGKKWLTAWTDIIILALVSLHA